MNILNRSCLSGPVPQRVFKTLWIIFLGASPLTASALEGVDIDKYEIYYGDFNGDGSIQDVYFHGLEKIILIHGSVITPIEIKGASGFAYYHNGDGSPKALDIPKGDLKQYNSVTENHGYTLSDLNGDGHLDMVVKLSGANEEQILLFSPGSGFFQMEVAAPLISTTVSYEYDEIGRLVDVLRPEGKSTGYEYDDADNRKVRSTVD